MSVDVKKLIGLVIQSHWDCGGCTCGIDGINDQEIEKCISCGGVIQKIIDLVSK